MHISAINDIGQIVFRRTVWAKKNCVICPIVRFWGNQLCKCLDRTMSKMPMVGLLSDNVLSSCLIIGQCCVQQLDSVVSTVQWLVYAVSNCPKACYLIVQQSNGQTVLFPTVQWLDSPVSNFPKVGKCCVKLSDSWTVLCPTVHWLVNAESNCPMAGKLSVQL